MLHFVGFLYNITFFYLLWICCSTMKLIPIQISCNGKWVRNDKHVWVYDGSIGEPTFIQSNSKLLEMLFIPLYAWNLRNMNCIWSISSHLICQTFSRLIVVRMSPYQCLFRTRRRRTVDSCLHYWWHCSSIETWISARQHQHVVGQLKGSTKMMVWIVMQLHTGIQIVWLTTLMERDTRWWSE